MINAEAIPCMINAEAIPSGRFQSSKGLYSHPHVWVDSGSLLASDYS